ncbi:MAG: helix-turn-helix transcriptional regulator [Burkholderiales bacterium]
MVNLLRLPKTLEVAGVSRSAWYALIRAGLAPPPVALGIRTAAWPDSEIDALNRARMAGLTNAELRELVKVLVEKRKVALREVLT